MVDSLAATMLLVIVSISLLVQVYSAGYMRIDPFRHRFAAYLSLFTLSMLILVCSDNLLMLFLG